jgi:uncharacterized membrane protein YraQ (UPF0718 family)
MMRAVVRFVLVVVVTLVCSVLIVLMIHPDVVRTAPLMNRSDVQLFSTMWMGIVLEALPFVLFGVLIAAIVQAFVPDALVRRIVPKHRGVATVCGALLGVVVPVCECGMVPVVRRMMMKGVPIHAATAFLLAGPIVNPVVFSASSLALQQSPSLVWWRMGLALAIAVIVGLVIGALFRTDVWKPMSSAMHPLPTSKRLKLWHAIDQSAIEAFDMLVLVVIGSAITALMQTTVPRESLAAVGDAGVFSVIAMMAYAFVLSICSTADAFVIAAFVPVFAPAAVLAFLVYGPMLDIKSVVMIFSAFRVRFAVALVLLVTGVTLLCMIGISFVLT